MGCGVRASARPFKARGAMPFCHPILPSLTLNTTLTTILCSWSDCETCDPEKSRRTDPCGEGSDLLDGRGRSQNTKEPEKYKSTCSPEQSG
eukprot:3590502-Rhodomonas_salina.2